MSFTGIDRSLSTSVRSDSCQKLSYRIPIDLFHAGVSRDMGFVVLVIGVELIKMRPSTARVCQFRHTSIGPRDFTLRS